HRLAAGFRQAGGSVWRGRTAGDQARRTRRGDRGDARKRPSDHRRCCRGPVGELLPDDSVGGGSPRNAAGARGRGREAGLRRGHGTGLTTDIAHAIRDGATRLRPPVQWGRGETAWTPPNDIRLPFWSTTKQVC